MTGNYLVENYIFSNFAIENKREKKSGSRSPDVVDRVNLIPLEPLDKGRL